MAITPKDLDSVATAAHTTEQLLSGDSNILDQILLMFEKGYNLPLVYWQVAIIVASSVTGWVCWYLLKKYNNRKLLQRVREQGGISSPEASSSEKTFWAKFLFNLRRLIVSISWAVFTMFFIFVFSLTARELNLLPHHSLPLEAIAWLILEAFIVIKIVVFIVHGAFANSSNIKSIDNALVWTIWCLVALQILGVLPKVTDWMETTKISVGNSAPITVWILFKGIITIALTLFVAKWISHFFESWFSSLPSIQANIKVVVERLVKVALMICAILIGLSAAGIDLTVLGVFGGAIGVGLGFGLQKIASNYVSGFIILMDRSIKIGDLINVAGVEGYVTDIKTRYTVLRAYDGSVTIIPNESFVTSNVRNITYSGEPGRTTIVMSVDYSCDIDMVTQLMTEVVERFPRVLRKPKPYTLLTNFGNDGIDLTSYFWVADPGNGTASLRSEISKTMLKEFNARNINIPYPQRDLRVISMPDVVCKVETQDS